MRELTRRAMLQSTGTAAAGLMLAPAAAAERTAFQSSDVFRTMRHWLQP